MFETGIKILRVCNKNPNVGHSESGFEHSNSRVEYIYFVKTYTCNKDFFYKAKIYIYITAIYCTYPLVTLNIFF